MNTCVYVCVHLASRDMISLLTEQISQKDAEIDELKTELEMCRRKTKIQELNTSYASPDSSKKTTLNYKNSSKEVCIDIINVFHGVCMYMMHSLYICKL